MKIIILLFIISLLFSTLSFCDELIVPFSCYPIELQESFAEKGLKLDLDPNARTKDSWGFLVNKGGEFVIYTYRSVTEEELTLVMNIIMRRDDG